MTRREEPTAATYQAHKNGHSPKQIIFKQTHSPHITEIRSIEFHILF